MLLNLFVIKRGRIQPVLLSLNDLKTFDMWDSTAKILYFENTWTIWRIIQSILINRADILNT